MSLLLSLSLLALLSFLRRRWRMAAGSFGTQLDSEPPIMRMWARLSERSTERLSAGLDEREQIGASDSWKTKLLATQVPRQSKTGGVDYWSEVISYILME